MYCQQLNFRAQYMHNLRNDALSQTDYKSDEVREHQELVNRFARSLLEENENASTTDNPLWMRQLLLPHLEQFHQVSTSSMSE